MQQSSKIEINNEAALKWVLEDENVCTTIPGMTTFDQLDQNFRVMNNMDNAEIPNLMRAFMYAKAYGNYVQAGMTVAELPRKKGLNVCRTCSSCTASCPNGIDIGSRVKTLIEERLYLG
jgi:predicted aldo/keto reductase-like oxidoreductase